MGIRDAVMEYLIGAYDPEAIILYGSFANETANSQSDFDALVIAESAKKHDASVICGTELDVFIYPPETFARDYDPEQFIQVYDAQIVLDRNGIAEQLCKRVSEFIESKPPKTPDELRRSMEWCVKMLRRSAREDSEGLFRRHWLITESLEIYCDVKQLRYFGPKKSILMLEKEDPDSYVLYAAALREFSHNALQRWIEHLGKLLPW